MARNEKNAVVTGAASGIGRGIALRLARDGVNVAVWDLDLSGARRTAEEVAKLGRRSLAVENDVSSFADAARAAERTQRDLGPVSILVNNAGIGESLGFLQTTEAQWDRMMAVHAKGTFNCTHALLQGMLDAGWGRVVNISSVAGLEGVRNMVHYAAAKAAILGFTKALAQEVAATGVTVNAVCPGVIDTPIFGKSNLSDAVVEKMVRRSPMRRIGKPEDIAAAVAYFASEDSSFATGQALSPNGGIWM